MYFKTRGALMFLALVYSTVAGAQTIGIGTDFPIATLDIRTTASMGSLNIDRELDNPSGSTSAFTLTDDSDWSAFQMEQVDVLNAKEVMRIIHNGLGDGVFIEMKSTSSGADGLQIWSNSNSQNAIQINNLGTSAWGLLNILDDSGVGIYNWLTDDNAVSVYSDLTDVTGSGYFFTNFDLSNLPIPTESGDGYALDAFVNTSTASVGSTSYGAVVGGDQYGVGHGILINHNGTNGRNAEFNITSASNSDAAVFATSKGTGEVILAQHSNNSIGSVVNVGSFQYIGSESRHHVGVYGYSAPAVGYGIGGDFTGDSYGVVGRDAGNGISGVHAVGNMSATGTKSFIIDHPLDPKNSYLRHFAVESDEVLNMYRGIAQVGRNGQAVVELPKYFSAININYTYQLTAIGTSTQPWVVTEIDNNRFVVGGAAGSKVSWTVHANRNDVFVKSNPEKVRSEFKKEEDVQGKFLDPQSWGLDESMSIFYNPVVIQEPATRGNTGPLDGGRIQERARQTNIGKTSIEDENGRQPIQRMEIRQPIKTMDEIH